MRIVFVRHGQTDWNAQNRPQGQTDIPLNDTGRKQARDLAGKLAVEYSELDVIFVSPLSRARETAEIINAKFNVPLVLDERLFEQSFGKLEGVDRDTLIGGNIGTHGLAIGEEEILKLGMETFTQVEERVAEFIREVTENHSDKTVLVVCHGGICRVVKWYFDGVEGNENWVMENAGILEYVI